MASLPIPFGYRFFEGRPLNYIEDRHLITFGPTRSGKGATVIIPALLRAEHSIVCIDPKGQNAAVTARYRRELHGETESDKRVHLLNPFNELGLGTSQFNPLAHLRIDQPNVVADTRSLADALIIGSERDAHFTDSATDLLHVIMLHLIEEKGGAATLPELRRMLTLPMQGAPGKRFGDMIGRMLESDHGFIRQGAGRFVNASPDNRELQSVISTAITQTFFLDDPNIAAMFSGHDFSMADLRAKPMTVYLILPGRYMEAYARFLRLVVTSGIDQLTVEQDGHPALFILDEFAAMQKLPAIGKAFGFSAGYKIQMWPFLQDLPQLKAIYPNHWETFLANAGVAQFFAPVDMTTAKHLQERGGASYELRPQESVSEVTRRQRSEGLSGLSRSYQEIGFDLLPPNMTMSLGRQQSVVLFGGTHSALLAERRAYYDTPDLKARCDPDPFHKGGQETERFDWNSILRYRTTWPESFDELTQLIEQHGLKAVMAYLAELSFDWFFARLGASVQALGRAAKALISRKEG